MRVKNWDQVYNALGINPDPRMVQWALRRISYDDFWVMFYVHVYSTMIMPEHCMTLSYARQKDGVYDALVRHMSEQIRARKKDLSFSRAMYWIKAPFQPCCVDFDSYNLFLEQAETGKLQFDRFVSGSYDKSVCAEYIDKFIYSYLFYCKEKMINPSKYEIAIAWINFRGPGALLYENQKSIFIDIDKEIIIDPLDVWHIESYQQAKYTYKNIPIIEHDFYVREAQNNDTNIFFQGGQKNAE